MQKRITVGLRQDVYKTLVSRGRFGESFSDLVSRLIEGSETHISSNDGGELPLTNGTNIEFISKPCRNNLHQLCNGKWQGLGLEIICICNCRHERDSHFTECNMKSKPNTNSTSQGSEVS